MTSKNGDNFRNEGEKALKRMTIFGFGKMQKYEDATDFFTKAGNAYKLANMWDSASDMFLKVADCHKVLENKSDYVNSIIEAANCKKKTDAAGAASLFAQAIEIYNEDGKFANSAKYAKEIAEIYESIGETERAIEYYEQSAALFTNENRKQAANPCLLKIALLTSNGGNYSRAAGIYETMGLESLEKTLSAYGAKSHFFACLLCYLAAGDLVATRNKQEQFMSNDHTFPTCRECRFVTQIIEAVESYDIEAFSNACADYDNITPLDPWKTSMLLAAKRNIPAGDEEEENIA